MHGRIDLSSANSREEEREKKKRRGYIGEADDLRDDKHFDLVSAGLPCARAWDRGAEERAQRASVSRHHLARRISHSLLMFEQARAQSTTTLMMEYPPC